jgi:hypothetical protein
MHMDEENIAEQPKANASNKNAITMIGLVASPMHIPGTLPGSNTNTILKLSK